MSEYKYKPYYKYNGPTRDQPFREELSAEEVNRRLELFLIEVGNYFGDDDAAVVRPIQDGVISITTGLAQQECDDTVKKCLNVLDLYARKILN